MFDMGFAEVVVIFIIALVVFGPEKLPQLARNVGLWMGRAKGLFSGLKYELEREAQNIEIMKRYQKEMDELGLNDNNTPTPPNSPKENSADEQEKQ
ncbi:MAG TPA: Sec-independent protein translocase protein TatB [Alcanivoracaceae bacterium]|nr:Sec-independent protein translocase protein TatB [Alcanivoracaceae bacterium]